MKKLLTLCALLMSAALQAQTVTPDPSGMTLTGKEWTRQVKMGWNLGNSFESSGGETGWGNPKTTKAMIHAVKEAGFNAIRIPVRWTEQLSNASTMTVKPEYLARVKEVVDWALEEDMFVIINTHHEEWLERSPFNSTKQENNRKLSALWKCIAAYFRDYDQRLAFAGTNEIVAKVNGQENWGTPTSEWQSVQNSYNQTFIDAVRGTGGRNYYRNLIVQVYAGNGYHGLSGFTVPTDKVEGRMSVEFHCYDPYGYGLLDGNTSNNYYYWGDKYKNMGKKTPSSNEKTLTDYFNRIRSAWSLKGLGVVLGEYGVTCHYQAADKQTQLENEQYYMKCMTAAAVERGFAPFVWDNNAFGNGNEKFGIFKRSQNMAIGNEYVLKGICEGAGVEYKPQGQGNETTEGGETVWEGDAVLDWGNGLQLAIAGDNFSQYGKDVWLILTYKLDFTDYDNLQFFYGDWDKQNNVSFTINGTTYEKEFSPSSVYGVGSGEVCTSVLSFSEAVYKMILQKGIVMQGHGIRLNRVALTSAAGIQTLTPNTSHPSSNVYTLDGCLVKADNPKPGIYVVKGKKVISGRSGLRPK